MKNKHKLQRAYDVCEKNIHFVYLSGLYKVQITTILNQNFYKCKNTFEILLTLTMFNVF